MSQSPPSAPRTRQVLLGIFICWQLWFLVSQNLFGWLEDLQPDVRIRRSEEVRPISRTIEHLAPGFTRNEGEGQVMALAKWVYETNKPWAQITGQHQQWALFSGTYARDVVFPALIVRWTDEMPDEIPWLSDSEFDWKRLLEKGDAEIEPKLILSDHEPMDLSEYFRWRQMRMRRYENGLHLVLRAEEGEAESDRAETWDQSIRDHLSSKGYLLTTYLKVRLKEARKEWGELPMPKQVILLLRRVHTTDPLDAPPHWTGPFTTPILLWQPPMDGQGEGSWKRFDPVRRVFRSWE